MTVQDILCWKRLIRRHWREEPFSDAGIFRRLTIYWPRRDDSRSIGSFKSTESFVFVLSKLKIGVKRTDKAVFVLLIKIYMVRKAIFPGSFDPFTAGHLNILKRALTMFDEVVVAVGVNIDKRGFFPNEKRIDIIRQATSGLEGVSIIQYDNLTIDKCRELGINHIVRGVRNMIDFETERSIADANRKLAPEIETIIIPTAQEFAHISSTAVRDLLKHGGDTSLFVPEGVQL